VLGGIEETRGKAFCGEVIERRLADSLERCEQRLVARAAGCGVAFGVGGDLALKRAEVVATYMQERGRVGRVDDGDLGALVSERLRSEGGSLGGLGSGEVAPRIGQSLLGGLPGQHEAVELSPQGRRVLGTVARGRRLGLASAAAWFRNPCCVAGGRSRCGRGSLTPPARRDGPGRGQPKHTGLQR
jgi:hypothetical protein